MAWILAAACVLAGCSSYEKGTDDAGHEFTRVKAFAANAVTKRNPDGSETVRLMAEEGGRHLATETRKFGSRAVMSWLMARLAWIRADRFRAKDAADAGVASQALSNDASATAGAQKLQRIQARE